ncbi:hypothetical protein TNCV_4087981 [Trichonephila clavipes]|nr:hypothetical protein TNCV_4087981 [Trichonephila clavipes]
MTHWKRVHDHDHKDTVSTMLKRQVRVTVVLTSDSKGAIGNRPDQMTAVPCAVDLGQYTRAKASQSQRCV